MERSTPFFPTINTTQPGLGFGDGLYEPFNAPAGTNLGPFDMLIQVRESFSFVRGNHSLKWGVETRFNRDTTIFDINPDGAYTFGGGPSYAQAAIPSVSGQHDIHPGDPLPDTLSAFLTATPFSYSVSSAPRYFPQGNHIGEDAERRGAYNFYFQDAWKVSPRVSVNYGLRYEVNSRIAEAHRLTSEFRVVNPAGAPAVPWTPGASIKYLSNPQPPYDKDWRGWGPRMAIDFQATTHTVLHVAGGITTILPDMWQDDFLTGNFPYTVSQLVTAKPNVAVPY